MSDPYRTSTADPACRCFTTTTAGAAWCPIHDAAPRTVEAGERMPKCVCGHDGEAHDGVCFALDYGKRECPCNEYRPRASQPGEPETGGTPEEPSDFDRQHGIGEIVECPGCGQPARREWAETAGTRLRSLTPATAASPIICGNCCGPSSGTRVVFHVGAARSEERVPERKPYPRGNGFEGTDGTIGERVTPEPEPRPTFPCKHCGGLAAHWGDCPLIAAPSPVEPMPPCDPACDRWGHAVNCKRAAWVDSMEPHPSHDWRRRSNGESGDSDTSCTRCGLDIDDDAAVLPCSPVERPADAPTPYRTTLFETMDRNYAERLVDFASSMLSELDRQFRPPEEPYTGRMLRARQWVEYVLHDAWLEIDRVRNKEV